MLLNFAIFCPTKTLNPTPFCHVIFGDGFSYFHSGLRVENVGLRTVSGHTPATACADPSPSEMLATHSQQIRPALPRNRTDLPCTGEEQNQTCPTLSRQSGSDMGGLTGFTHLTDRLAPASPSAGQSAGPADATSPDATSLHIWGCR